MKNGTKKTSRGKIIAIVVGVITAVVGVTVAVLAMNGFFEESEDEERCPLGQYRVCGILGGGEEVCGCYSDPDVVLKPIIYLYPETETEVSVRLGLPEKLTVSYPKYEDGWKVLAKPDGSLKDLKTGRELYSLYWEGEDGGFEITDEGFVVRGEEAAEFLEEKLAILGLNEREAEEFIIYWLPRMQANEFNYVRFATEAEIAEYMPLEVVPKPDTVIRILMILAEAEAGASVKEQVLVPAPAREGFTVVEWGGNALEKH